MAALVEHQSQLSWLNDPHVGIHLYHGMAHDFQEVELRTSHRLNGPRLSLRAMSLCGSRLRKVSASKKRGCLRPLPVTTPPGPSEHEWPPRLLPREPVQQAALLLATKKESACSAAERLKAASFEASFSGRGREATLLKLESSDEALRRNRTRLSQHVRTCAAFNCLGHQLGVVP